MIATPRDADDIERGAELGAADFRGQARRVARDLVGALLLVEAPGGPVGGPVVETEAYVNAVDPASHLAAGRTPRTESFFRGAGTIYVYSIHGHQLLNVISAYGEYPEGILIRALEPTHDRALMRERRGRDDPAELASGPGKLAQALGVTRGEFDGEPLAESRLSLYRTDWVPDVTASRRIGVAAAEDWPLRFTATGSPFVSRPPKTEALDYDAVEGAYRRLGEGGEEWPTVDGE